MRANRKFDNDLAVSGTLVTIVVVVVVTSLRSQWAEVKKSNGEVRDFLANQPLFEAVDLKGGDSEHVLGLVLGGELNGYVYCTLSVNEEFRGSSSSS